MIAERQQQPLYLGRLRHLHQSTIMHAAMAAQNSQEAPGKDKPVVPVSSRMHTGRAMNLDVWSIYKSVLAH